MVCLSIVVFSACSKKKTTTVDPNAKQHNQDVSDTKSESDNVNTDVNNAISGMTAFGKNGSTNTAISICGAMIDSSQAQAAIPTIIITFDGTTTCPNPSRIRSGQIKVELIAGTHWTDAGAQLRVTHTNYKVTFPTLGSHYLTFNGTKYLTNVNGINWISLYIGTSTASIRERSYDMQVTFDNGQIETWKTARLSTWGIKNFSEIYATVNGDTTINGKTIDSWGTTRFGTTFTTEMVQPWYSSTACGWWAPTSGKYTSTTDNFSVTATLGVNSNGGQVSSGCAYGFKLDWNLAANSSSGEVVLPYW
ncbi:MAG: hypothetical protein JWO06_3789 [Bacteroidota bacterium]|nr:hypothetical protein [Bacteroidota bacterium]